MSLRQRFAVLCLSLVTFYALHGGLALPLDDTLRNGLWEDEESHISSSVYTALSSSSTQPSIREAALYLGIGQHMQAPELTSPPRMPQCLSSSKVSKALAAAINSKYAGQLQMNASSDTTYIQNMRQCDYSSFITYSGPESVRTDLVDAANRNKLCDLLPKYCKALNIVPATAPSSTSAAAAAAAVPAPVDAKAVIAQPCLPPHLRKTPPASGSNADSSSSSSDADLVIASTPIDSQQQYARIWHRRSSISSTDPYVLQSTSGTSSLELPPVLDFKCVKHNYTQIMDHFAGKRRNYYGSGEGIAGRLQQWDNDYDFAPEEVAKQKQRSEDNKKKTFTQVYWVCDAAWPKEANKQKQSGNVIVFLGNESPLGIPKQPIVFENARRLNALVILVEHRYYGESLPYPEPENEKVPTEKYRWLTIEQVIEDTATVVQHVRKERGVPSSVPNIVIGGSYGGMIASYHRVVRPDVFDAAVAASAPIYYIVETKMWRHSSNRYHQFIEDAANVMSGSPKCSNTVTAALKDILQLGTTEAGRQTIVDTLHLCGSGPTALPDEEAVLGLQNEVIGTFQGLAQVNNQPPVLGEMAIACGVINNATAAGKKPMEAVAAMWSYFNSNGSSNWCYNFTYNPKFSVFRDASNGYNSYTYQCCTQGTVYSSELPARGSDGTLNPEKIPVPVSDIEQNCRNIFGRHVPDLHGPGFARHIMPLLKEYGNVVFTNGDLDGWAGGSLGLLPVVEGDREESSLGTLMYDIGNVDVKDGGLGKHSNIAYVVYRNASHCTDTHTNTWRTPNEPAEWKKQRALAMDYAVEFARSKKPVV